MVLEENSNPKDAEMISKEQLVDNQGKPLTQGLFLEINYDERFAVYTLKDYDHTYNGKVYPSLKALYLKEEDPTEYIFASKYLLGWNHWQRMCENKALAKHINEWRNELELKLRAQAVRALRDMCNSENGNFQAAKFLADRGWEKRGAGRPSKAEIEKRLAQDKVVGDEFDADILRMDNYRKD